MFGNNHRLLFVCLEAAVGVQEDRKKVPWSDKETIILLEVWGDPQVEHSVIMKGLHYEASLPVTNPAVNLFKNQVFVICIWCLNAS